MKTSSFMGKIITAGKTENIESTSCTFYLLYIICFPGTYYKVLNLII